MKKRFLKVTLAAILVLSIIAVFAGCEDPNVSQKFEYDSVYINSQIEDSFATAGEMFEFVYEDTYLKLYEDGTWVIDTPLFLSFNSDIDKGTYTVEDGAYTFEGFEYGMKTYGKETTDGFEIYFLVPNGVGYTTAMAIYYRR